MSRQHSWRAQRISSTPFGISRPPSVLDAVVDHLDEVTRSGRSAVEIPQFGSARGLLAPGRARNVADPGRDRPEDRVQSLNGVRVAPDHHAVAALEAPDSAARPDVQVVDALRAQLLLPADVVDVAGVAAVDEDVARLDRK